MANQMPVQIFRKLLIFIAKLLHFIFTKYTGSRGKSDTNDASAELMGQIRRIMDDAYARCTAILEQYRPQLVEVAEYLLANETMTAEEFEKVFRTE